MKQIDISGKKFGMLTVIKYSHAVGYLAFWLCKCDCGKLKVLKGRDIKYGNTKSCGCLRDKLMHEQKHALKHGMKNKKLYSVWRAMKKRCECKTVYYFKRYGGRGIKVCDEWHDPSKFFKWALSHGYKEGLSIDRINNDGNYYPSNCQWITRSENTKKMHQERK